MGVLNREGSTMPTNEDATAVSPIPGAGISHDSRPVAFGQIVAFPLDSELILCHRGTGEVFVLNQTGARIWELCDGSRTISEIAREIAASYPVTYRRAVGDVCDLVSRLCSATLMEMQGQASSSGVKPRARA